MYVCNTDLFNMKASVLMKCDTHQTTLITALHCSNEIHNDKQLMLKDSLF